MHLTLLPAARAVYAHENAQLAAASARATGLPLGRRDTGGRARRRLSSCTGLSGGCPGVPTARSTSGCCSPRAAGAVALIWMAVALLGGPGGPAAGHRARLDAGRDAGPGRHRRAAGPRRRDPETSSRAPATPTSRPTSGPPGAAEHAAVQRRKPERRERRRIGHGRPARGELLVRGQPAGAEARPRARLRCRDATGDRAGTGLGRDAVRPAGSRSRRRRPRRPGGFRRQHGGGIRGVHRAGSGGGRARAGHGGRLCLGACPGGWRSTDDRAGDEQGAGRGGGQGRGRRARTRSRPTCSSWTPASASSCWPEPS